MSSVAASEESAYVPFSPPCLTDAEAEAVQAVLQSPWLTTGPNCKAFEEEFAAVHEAEAALALNSCTAGLHLALLGHDIGPGDEVIVPTHTFCASANVVEHVGARPVLVDVEPDTLNIDVEQVIRAITPNTKAVTVVHYAGHPAEMDALVEVCEKFGIALIEDAAHAVTARYRGRLVGSRKNYACFSFYATKNLTTGEGGMVTGSAELIDRIRPMSLHGMSRDAWKRFDRGSSWRYDVLAPGFKYNLTDIAAALGRVQLRRMPEMQARRFEIVEQYHRALSGVDSLTLPIKRDHVDTSWHLYVIKLNLDKITAARDQVMNDLLTHDIGVSVHYCPVHMMSYYRDKYSLDEKDFPVATEAFSRIISLPLSAAHTDSQVNRVCEVLKTTLEKYRA